MVTKKRIKYCLAMLASAFVAALMFISALMSSAIAVNAESSDGKYYADYSSLSEVKTVAEELTAELAAEGDVLLKNDGALPMSGNEKISIFGVRADNLVGASDSESGGFSTSLSSSDSTMAEALSSAGFRVNPTLERFYDSDESEIGEERLDFTGQCH